MMTRSSTSCSDLLKVEWHPEGNVWISAGYLKALVSANVLIEGLGLTCIFNVWWQQVTWPYLADLSLLSAWRNRGEECNLGHLLVPKVIIKGWDGSTLPNPKKCLLALWICQTSSSCSIPATGLVVHGQGAIEQMSLVSVGFNLQIWEFQSTMKVIGKLLVYYWSLIRDL